MTPAYIIANVNVTNPEQYEQYRRLSTAAIGHSGAEVLVRGGDTQALEGQAPARTVILKFPSLAAAREFYDGEPYKKARQAREGAAQMTMYIVEGMAT